MTRPKCGTAGRPVETTLLDLLCLVPRFETTEPVDQVYGILGLLRRADNDCGASGEMAASQQTLQPDYAKSVAEVYSDAVRATISVGPSGLRYFSLVEQCQSPTADDNEIVTWPSWVPQLHKARYHHSRRSSRSIRPKAGGNLSPLIRDGACYIEIRIGGLLVSTITSVQPVPKPQFEPENVIQYAQYMHELFTSATDITSKSHTDDIDTVVSWTLTSGGPDLDHVPDAMEKFGPDYRNFRRVCIAAATAASPDEEAIRKLDMHWTLSRHDAFIEVFRTETYGKALLTTTSGGSIGLAQNNVNIGDAVCILFGCDWPVILQPADEGWAFVALAYVYDLMDVSRIH